MKPQTMISKLLASSVFSKYGFDKEKPTIDSPSTVTLYATDKYNDLVCVEVTQRGDRRFSMKMGIWSREEWTPTYFYGPISFRTIRELINDVDNSWSWVVEAGN